MAVHVNEKGDLVITIPNNQHSSPMEELELRRSALYDAIQEHNQNDYLGSGVHYGLTLLLKDLDPTLEQWGKVLNTG